MTDAYRFIETRRLLSFDERHARYVHVDSCCDLPMPKRDIEGEGSDARVVGLSITPWQRDFFRVLNALQTTVDYDDYVRRAGFEVRDSAE